MIYKFHPYLKTVIWGGSKIALRKGIADAPQNVGESWEISGVPGFESVVAEGPDKGLNLVQLIRRHGAALVGKKVYERFGETFPLLIKIIDAHKDLSVQVHPNDALARERHNSMGKTEMWYVLETEPGATIYAGLSSRISPEEYAQLVEQKRIMDVVAAHPSAPGDIFFLPAGRVHAIGAGNMLAEIQQTSDVTYRIYDYDRRDDKGNARELHTEMAKDAIDYEVHSGYRSAYTVSPDGCTPLIHCDYFDVFRLDVSGTLDILPADDSFMVLMGLEGECTITVDGVDTSTLRAYESLLIPASARSIRASGNAILLKTTV